MSDVNKRDKSPDTNPKLKATAEVIRREVLADLEKARTEASKGTRSDDEYIGKIRRSRQRTLTSDIDKLQEKVAGLARVVEGQKSKNLEILAIFGALFTFITIQVQQLSFANKETGIFVGILALGGLMLFSAILVLATTFRQWWKTVISIILIVLSIVILFAGWQSFNKYLSQQDTCTYLKREVTIDALNEKTASQHSIQISQLYNNLCK